MGKFKTRSLIIIVTLSLILISCGEKRHKNNSSNNRYLIGSIKSAELINVDIDQQKKIDSIAAFKICKRYPNIHQWEKTLFGLKEIMPKNYLKNNLEYERERSIKDFLELNNIYEYTWENQHIKHKGYITKYKSKPSEWNNTGFDMSVYIVSVSGTEIEPILVSNYIHTMFVTEYKVESTTNFYSDNSIDFIESDISCSDIEILEQESLCDSTITTIKYHLDRKRKKMLMNSSTKVITIK